MKYEELATIAFAATPGPWTLETETISSFGIKAPGKSGGYWHIGHFTKGIGEDDEGSKANVNFAITFHPAFVLSLLSRAEKMEGVLKQIAEKSSASLIGTPWGEIDRIVKLATDTLESL